jgi:hypothetical protein
VLPKPPEWPAHSDAYWRSRSAAWSGVALVGALSVVAENPRNAYAAVALAGAGVFGVAATVGRGLAFGRDGEPRAADGGVELPFSRARHRLAYAERVAWLLGCTAVALAPVGWFRLLALPAALLVARSAPRRRRLLLTPEAVTYADGPTVARLPWERVTEVAAGTDAGWLPGPRRTLVLRGAAGDVTVPAERLGVDPVLAYWALRYYAAHPEARAELARARAVDRIVVRDLTR